MFNEKYIEAAVGLLKKAMNSNDVSFDEDCNTLMTCMLVCFTIAVTGIHVKNKLNNLVKEETKCLMD